MPKLWVFTALILLYLTNTTDCHRSIRIEISPELSEIKEGLPTRISCIVRNNNGTTLKWHIFDETETLKPLGPNIQSLRRQNSSHYYSAVMSIRKVSRTDTGVYVCVAKNQEGQTIGRQNASLTVLYVDPINIQSVERSIQRHGDHRLICKAPNGNPRPTIDWYKENRELDFDIYVDRDLVTKKYFRTEIEHTVIARGSTDTTGEYVCQIGTCCGTFNVTVILSYFPDETTDPNVVRVRVQSPYAGATIMVPLVFSANNDLNPF